MSAEGVYQRGGLFFAFVAAYAWGMLVLLHSILEAGRRCRYRLQDEDPDRVRVRSFMGTTVQVALPHVHTSWTCVTMALALHYGFICEFHGALDALTGLYSRKSFDSRNPAPRAQQALHRRS